MTTFHQLLIESARRHGSRVALLFDDQTTSYEMLLAQAEGTAAGLIAEGISPADNVALVMDNSLECVAAWLASSVIGCTEVPINPQYRGELLAYLLRDSETDVVICDAAYFDNVVAIAADLPRLRRVLVAGAGACEAGAAACDQFIVRSEREEGREWPEDPPERVILYTSGTTGPSKGVIHTQRSSLTLAYYNAKTLGYDQSDRLLNFFPLYHQNARYTGVVPALCSGASIRLQRKLSTSTFWETCDRDGTTAFNYLGSVLRLILNATPAERNAGNISVKKAFGAGAPPPVWHEVEERLGIRLVETYGLSEAPMATVNARMGARPSAIGSAGRASDLFEVAILDPNDRVLGPDQIGEIGLRPKRPDALMIGYYGKDSSTVRAFRNLWFHSGDRGRLSIDGDLFFEEREKDAIRRRGENISAWEVEGVLDLHPDVVESAVYAIEAEESDEEVAVALVLRRHDADLSAILRFAQERLPRYAVPSFVRIVPDLPRTPTEKVQKSVLRSFSPGDHQSTSVILENGPEPAL